MQSSLPCPFRPHPGALPRLWVGREAIQDRFKSPYANQAHLVGRCDLLIGSTGLGKSALLGWTSQAAAEAGRPVVRVTASGATATAAGLGDAISAAVDRADSIGRRNTSITEVFTDGDCRLE